MPKLPVISGEEAIKALERLGFTISRSHALRGNAYRDLFFKVSVQSIIA
jgi:hypothetical protein